MTMRQIELEILRYDPEQDAEPRYETFSVPCNEDWVILDAINHVKDNIDASLAYRWSCHMAVCGSCGMMVNGDPVLSCKAFLRDYPDKIRVEPLANFPIERDLIIVMDDFMAKLKESKAYLIPKETKSVDQGEYLQTPLQLDAFKQYTLCINCMLCYSACPQYGLNSDFIGPAALALSYRYNSDSRDGGREERQEVFASHDGVWECSFVGACSEVCPKHVDPAQAIQLGKMDSAIDFFTSFLIPGGRR